ncbi:zinc-finger domain-containing protein [Lysobacter korlensis]|uniref:Zinc-finger domain-containing protein n=1 Tax=Lysobacter korlensis TaxID=553636 RepID=A0ABV6RT27_9GAMM
MTAASDRSNQPNAHKRVVVSRADLPMSCPLPAVELWNSHPRVYLPLEAERECECPYCGTLFVLED